MDGTQSPGINYNSIDGLTTVNATSITVNGSTINLDSYVPYTGALNTVNLNAKTLTNIANAVGLTDAVNLQTMNAKNYIGTLGSYRVEVDNGTGDIVNNFTTLTNYSNGTLCSQETDFARNSYGQTIALYDTNPLPGFCGSITPAIGGSGNLSIIANLDLNLYATTITIDGLVSSTSGKITIGCKNTISTATNVIDAFTVNNAAGVSIFSVDTLTSAISCNTVVNANSNKIINLQAATNPGDAVRYDQIGGTLPGGSIQGSYVIYSGSAYINNATNNINLGAYSNTTATSSINIGQYAGYGNTSANSHIVNIGQSTGSSGQNSQTVAVGSNAGATNQGVGSVAIGYRSQRTNTVGGYGSVSVGSLAGANDVGNNCVGIGGYAGYTSQSNNAIAIGFQAGYSNQHSNSIIINATGSQLNSVNSSATYIAPLRSVTTDNRLYYNTTSKEVSYIADNAYWSLFSNTASGGNYCFIYQASLPTQGYWGDMLSVNYAANVNTNFGTAVWENPLNPTTRPIIITIPYNGMYQINVTGGAAGPVAEYIIKLNIDNGTGLTKVVDTVDFYGVNLNYYENAGWSGTYYFTANTTLSLTPDSTPAGNVAYASFSGFLVRRT